MIRWRASLPMLSTNCTSKPALVAMASMMSPVFGESLIGMAYALHAPLRSSPSVHATPAQRAMEDERPATLRRRGVDGCGARSVGRDPASGRVAGVALGVMLRGARVAHRELDPFEDALRRRGLAANL